MEPSTPLSNLRDSIAVSSTSSFSGLRLATKADISAIRSSMMLQSKSMWWQPSQPSMPLPPVPFLKSQ